jgi:alcohol dehydrogenase class IV
MTAEMRIPPILQIGGGSFATVADLLLRLRCRRPLLVTDPFLMKNQLAAKLATQIRDAGLCCDIFHATVADPTTAVVEAGAAVFQLGGHDSLVSLGGGSPIDTAKAIGMLSVNKGKVRDYRVPRPIPLPGPTHVAIPTTAGTGSEVTRFTIIIDTETGEKMLLAGETLLPAAAVVDYELTLTMPPRLTADTGTDSLTHAIEAFVSRKANPFTDTLALSAMKIIWRVLPISFHEPGNLPAREAMMLAATQAGLAFSNSSVALVHGMSRPLGAHFHIPHGLSNAMLLPAVTAFSVRAAVERYAECARTMGVAQTHDTDEVAAELLVGALGRRNEELEVPSPKKWGVAEERYFSLLSTMAMQALASGSPENNPRIATANEIEELYRQVWR